MSLWSVIGLIPVFFFNIAWAQPDHCSDPSIAEIPTAFDFRDEGSVKIPYKFQIIPGHSMGLPIVINLPGGPGQAGIMAGEPIPLEWTVINIDPRGAGCNQLDIENFEDTFRTDQLAYDVLEIVKQLGISNYILHGVSYGTVWATVAAKRAKDWDYPLPQSVILEGVLGKHMDAQDYVNEFKKQWELLKEANPEAVKPLLGDKLPWGLDAEVWGALIMNSLMAGNSPTQGHLLTDLLLPVFAEVTAEEGEFLREFIQSMTQVTEDISGELHASISCREIFENYEVGSLLLVQGELVEGELQSVCDGIPAERYYDSSEWQIPVPIYYLQGELDPATPLTQALHHYEGQELSEKYFILVPGGGHNPFGYGLEDCARDIMNSILLGQSPNLSNCQSGAFLYEAELTHLRQAQGLH